MRFILLLIALLPFAASAGTITWTNDGGDGWDDGAGEEWSAADINAVKTAVDGNAADIVVLEAGDEVFYATNYTSGSWSGGIVEALAACNTAGGGVVVVPRGVTSIDADSRQTPIIQLPEMERGSDEVFYGGCALHGYGRGGREEDPSDFQGGSMIVFQNLDTATAQADGDKVGVAMSGIGQTVKDIMFWDDDPSSANVVIEIASRASSSYEHGQRGVINWLLSDVTVSGNDGNGKTGTGIQFQFALKGNMRDVTVIDLGYGLVYQEVPCTDDNNIGSPIQTSGSSDGQCDYDSSMSAPAFELANNSNIITGSKIRENGFGIYVDGFYGFIDQFLFGSTIEGNLNGVWFGDNSSAYWSGFGNHFENTLCADTSPDDGDCDSIPIVSTAENVNVYIDSAFAVFREYGSRLGGTVTTSISRTTAQNSRGPDMLFASPTSQPVSYASGASIAIIGDSYNYTEDLAGGGTFFGGVNQIHATDCPGSALNATGGETCYEADANVLYVCEPQAATGQDGVCDESAEWIDMTTVTSARIATGALTAADAAADLATQAELDAKSAASSTDNAVARFDSTAGDVQNSGVTIDDSNNLTVPGDVTGGTSGAFCLIIRDSDDAGNSACEVLNGTWSCETDTNDTCGDAT